MTREEAKTRQDELAKNYNLSYWYGTKCTPCCGVFPKLMVAGGFDPKDTWYECEVCGKRTERKTMPWLAEEAWNRGDLAQQQTRLEGF